MNVIINRVILIFASFFMVAAPLSAHSVAPLRLDFAPSGQDAIQQIRIENPGSKPVTLSISVIAGIVQPDGSVEETPADDQFLIFPPQMIVQPQKTQLVQVRYVGDPTITEGQMFYIRTAQVPVDLAGGGEGQGNIKVGIDYVTAAEVAPSGSEANLTIASFEPGDDGVTVVVANSGDAHGLLSNTGLEIVGQAGSLQLALSEIDLGQTRRVPPNGQRHLPVPASLLQSVGTIERVALVPTDNQ